MTSICLLDFKENMCWVNKAAREGYPLIKMEEEVWFGINKKDLDRIQKSLNH